MKKLVLLVVIAAAAWGGYQHFNGRHDAAPSTRLAESARIATNNMRTEGSMIWIGPAIGSFGGLVAILFGALYNAHLTRKRDETLRSAERDSLRAALAAELIAMSANLEVSMGIAHDEVMARSPKGIKVIAPLVAPPTSITVDRLGDRIGLLPAQQTADFLILWHRISLMRNMVNGTLAELRAGVRNQKGVEQRFGLARDLAVDCHDMAKTLSGALGHYTKPIQTTSPEDAATTLWGRPGNKAVERSRALCEPAEGSTGNAKKG